MIQRLEAEADEMASFVQKKENSQSGFGERWTPKAAELLAFTSETAVTQKVGLTSGVRVLVILQETDPSYRYHQILHLPLQSDKIYCVEPA